MPVGKPYVPDLVDAFLVIKKVKCGENGKGKEEN
jgi:hypothetical protein